jgi:ankyrin repeat protein
LLQYGSPNPYAKDINGVTPIHVACAKLDWETFQDLVALGGDPMIPDQDGNTFLHLLCKGTIKDIEYDFAKMACTQFQIRLTRNSEGKNPIQLLKENETKMPRGQPNYKRSLTEFLQSQVQ